MSTYLISAVEVLDGEVEAAKIHRVVRRPGGNGAGITEGKLEHFTDIAGLAVREEVYVGRASGAGGIEFGSRVCVQGRLKHLCSVDEDGQPNVELFNLPRI